MADIDIVPKRRSYVWLWVVIAIIIALIVWYAIAHGGSASSQGVSLILGSHPGGQPTAALLARTGSLA